MSEAHQAMCIMNERLYSARIVLYTLPERFRQCIQCRIIHIAYNIYKHAARVCLAVV